MGEAKRRRDLGPTRKIRFEGYELFDLVQYLVTNAAKPEATKVADRKQRLAFRIALDQLDILDIWHRVKVSGGQMLPEDMPKGGVKELTVDNIETLLTILSGPMDFRDTLNIGGIEEKLEDAKHGLYVLDEPEVEVTKNGESEAPPPAEEAPAVDVEVQQ